MNETIPLEKLKFPLGHFNKPDTIPAALLSHWISDIESFPERLKKLAVALSDDQLGWNYRPGGWTIKQVVHHCADSHMNAFIRCKLALTEENPTIKPYEEALWATLEDSLPDVSASILILEGLHVRWAQLLKSLTRGQFSCTYLHPASQKTYRLDEVAGLYAWHGNHHLAHIAQALEHKGEFNADAV